MPRPLYAQGKSP